MTKRNKKSPLKGPPLRYPGQSIDERRAEIIGKLEAPAFIAAVFIALTVAEVYSTLTGTRSPLWMYVVIAAAAVVFAATRVWLAIPTLKALRQARDGERIVGQYLDVLREQGYRVFHDVVGTGFNVDHILIGPGGIYTVETKTWSKPAKGAPKVWFDGEEIKADGMHIDRDPVIQARAQAKWIKDLLCESTGKVLPVRPVILFPGWFVEPTRGAYKELWVLNPKALPEFLKNERLGLSPEDIKLASFHLSRFIRATPAA
jgi:hypothetical protein